MTELAVVILTKDVEQHIVDCLASVPWADERVIFDCYSTDRTTELAKVMGARVLQHPWKDFASQRNAALEMVEAEWIFFLDSDERATPELGEEMRRVIREREEVGWWVPRRNIIWGKWIRHAGWSPDPQLRLLKRGRARYDPAREVHEVVILDGAEGYLENPLTHYNYATISQFLAKQERYTDYEAGILFKQGERPRARAVITMALREFWRRYVTLRGFKDGMHGLLLSGLMGYYASQRYLRLRRLVRAAS
jgi:glycosyltransferase involved in cell wall biosynthesis